MDEAKTEDLSRFWRQTLRWLIADVPGRVSLSVDAGIGTTQPTTLRLRVVDQDFKPLDHADVTIVITRPDGQQVALSAEPTADAPGEFQAAYLASEPGAYRITATAVDPDGAPLTPTEAGLVVDPDASEFASITPNRALLAGLAERTGGRVVERSALGNLGDDLLARKAQVMEIRTWPLWHNAWVLTLIVVLLVGEWVLRRRKGMA